MWKPVIRKPSLASLSRFGVLISEPYAPASEKPRSSAMMITGGWQELVSELRHAFRLPKAKDFELGAYRN